MPKRRHFVSVVALVLASACGVTHSPVSVERTTAGVTIHCESLGEYPSSVGVVELIDTASGRMIWRIEPEGDVFQLHNFSLRPGSNAASIPVSWGVARRVIPAGETFGLETGRSYRVNVCAPNGLKRCGSADFTL